MTFLSINSRKIAFILSLSTSFCHVTIINVLCSFRQFINKLTFVTSVFWRIRNHSKRGTNCRVLYWSTNFNHVEYSTRSIVSSPYNLIDSGHPWGLSPLFMYLLVQKQWQKTLSCFLLRFVIQNFVLKTDIITKQSLF